MAALVMLFTMAVPVFGSPEAQFFVALDGNDAWSGRVAQPNPQGTDGPFATLARAQQAVRELRAADPNHTGPVRVLVRGGMYALDRPLVFGSPDGGTPESPTIIESYPGETPVISGGVRLTGFRVTPDGYWELHLPPVERGEWSFSQLFVNGSRRYRPRVPADWYARIAGQLPPSSGNADDPPDRFQYPRDTFRADWPDLDEVEVLVFHSWTMDRLRVKALDERRRIVTFTAPTLSNNWFFDLRSGKRFIIENVRAALDAPGEWYLDRKTGILTYVPLPGEDPTTAEVVAPRLDRLVQIAGDAEVGLPVEHLVFRGLTFAHTNWVTPAEGWRCPQSECHMGAAIRVDGARHCVFENCTLTHLGTYAIELVSGCQHNRIEGCQITDMAAGGIKIGEMFIRDDPVMVTSHNVVRNNLIAHGGRMHAAGMGVWIAHSPYNVVEHNEICDLYQTGISVGWSWGYGPSLAHDNTIAYNRIHHIGQGVTDDMGGIYTLGLSPGTVLHHNLIHDVSCDGYGGRGIYFDEGTTELLAENNIVYHTDTGAFMQHYGRENRVINNIFALARGGQLDRLREEEHISFTFERNLVYYDDTGYLLAENWNNDKFRMNRNLYWDASGKPVMFGTQTLEQWQARGHDVDSIVADPLFVDPARGDFRLREGSPALALGFQPIDASTIGRLPDPGPEPALAPRAFPPKVPPAPVEIDEDFELLDPGDKVPGATTCEENDQATIRVSDETAASGAHSLKFIDMPGQRYNFNPHLYFTPGFSSGMIHGHFDVRLEPGIQLCYEWRDVTVFYRSGPLLRIYPDGRLEANGTVVATLPHGVWIGFDVLCGLGPEATGTYDLTVTVPGQAEPLRFVGLKYDPEFKSVHWLLFTSEELQDGVCYVDNIRLRPAGQR